MSRRLRKCGEYRRRSELCLEVARHLSYQPDRAMMMEMAQRGLQVARDAEPAEKPLRSTLQR